MKLNEDLFEDSNMTYSVTGYLNSNLRGVMESETTEDLDDAYEIAWEYVSQGLYVEIKNEDTGESVVYNPDTNDFEGEFSYENRELLARERNWKDWIGESMKRKSNKALKESLSKENRGKFAVDIKNAVLDVFWKYEDMGEEPSNEDIEFAFEYFKRKFMGESLKESIRRHGRALKESLPYEKRGKFFTAITRAIQGVLIDFGLDEEAILHPELAPSKEDIELALEIFKKNYFNTFYKESLTNRPRRTVNESLRKSGRKLNETLLDVVLDRIDGEPYNPREFYDYVNGWYNDVAHEMDEGEEEDVADAIIRGLKDSIGYIGSNPDNDNAQQLYKFVKDSTWLTNGKTGETPDYIRQLHNTMNEDLEPEAIDEPEKAEITWVDENGEQKVSTVELVDKSFPKTALKFSQEHNDCSIINCTAPLKGAQKEDEPKEVPLTEGYLEANGLADRSPNYLRHMLGRLKNDCEYVINQNASLDRLWFTNDSMAHCALMREIYHKLDDMGYNPEDIVSLEKIDEYDNILYDMSDYSSSMYESLNESEETDGLANLISNEINGEFETTNGYRNLRQAASEIAPDMLPVIDDIMDEENTHVGQLQTLLSMVDDSAENIDVGAEEAEDQLEDEDAEIEHNDEVDADFAEIKKSDDEDADLEVKDDFDFDDEPFDEE